MQSRIKLVVCAFILVALFPYGLCIKCWDCRSSYEPACGYPFNNSTLPITDCKHVKDSLPDLCSKISRNFNGNWSYTRGCADVNVVDPDGGRSCVKRTDFDGAIIEHCICNDKDGCNSSYNFTPTKMLLYSLAFLTIAVKKIAL